VISRRVVVPSWGGPEVLKVVEEDPAPPRPSQVGLRVHAAGVAFGDVMRRRGVLAPPWTFTPGYDVVGVVETLGSSVRDIAVGDRVAAMMPGPGFGGYADRVCLDESRLVAVPEGLSDTHAVALGLNYITAFQLLNRIAPLVAGQRILIHGAAGGVGTAVVDLGQWMGLEMYGTASAPKHAFLKAHGCTPIDYRSEDFVARIATLTDEGVHVAIDGIGGSHLARSYQTLTPDGVLIMLGISGELSKGLGALATTVMHLTRLKLHWDARRVEMYRIMGSRGSQPNQCKTDWSTCMDLATAGKIAPTIAAEIPLEQVAEAHRLLDNASVIGKIVLTCV
jgi:NADPH:quinone reductase-like Zn-dependent oxidoreductase